MSIERHLVLQVKGNSYTIEFPNVGTFQKIESLKQVLSNGMYSGLMSMATTSSSEALDMIDMEAYLSMLAPKLIKDLKCETFGELGLEDYMELRVAYREQFIPWWMGILEMLQPKVK